MNKTFFSCICLLASTLYAVGQVHFTLQPDVYGANISESQYGIFFEEINHAADGGLWSEMVSNRSFEDSQDKIENWSSRNATKISLSSKRLMNAAQQQYLHVASASGGANIVNDGYWGMRLDGQSAYTLTFFARADAAFSTTLTARLIDYNTSEVLLSASKDVLSLRPAETRRGRRTPGRSWGNSGFRFRPRGGSLPAEAAPGRIPAARPAARRS